MLSYTKAILDYKLATHHEEKIIGDTCNLVKIKVYFPSPSLLEWRESIATTPGAPTAAVEKLKAFTKALEKELGVKAVHTGYGIAPQGTTGRVATGNTSPILLVVKTMNNRYKLAGDFCVRLYYAPLDSGENYECLHFPANPSFIEQCDAKDFLATYDKILSAYNVAKDYVNTLRERITVLKDEL